MAGKRKRPKSGRSDSPGDKRQRISPAKALQEGVVRQNLLSQYYSKVLTLREYLLSKLPPSSKVRRKKIISVTARGSTDVVDGDLDNECLARHLDGTLVGVSYETSESKVERWKQWTSFSQVADNSESTIRVVGNTSGCYVSEVCGCFLSCQRVNEECSNLRRTSTNCIG